MSFLEKRIILAVSTWTVVALLLNWLIDAGKRRLMFTMFFGVVVLPITMVVAWQVKHSNIPRQFSVRTLFVATTLAAVILGIVTALM